VHVKNATRLNEIITLQGWPTEENVGKDGAEAAWLIAQHAIGDPQLQRQSLPLLRSAAASGHVPMWHAAYLADRIALYEGRPQRYGTQWVDDPIDGRTRPWKLVDSDRVNEFRADVGLPPLHPIPERGPDCRPTNGKRSKKRSAGGKSGSLAKAGQAELLEARTRRSQIWLKLKLT
jgi:hypothetical protein